MLCDTVRGNVFVDDPARYAAKERDEVELSWRDCTRRAVRATSRTGRKIGILLPLGEQARHGDVVYEDDHAVVFVTLRPCEVIVAEFAEAGALARAALELGNLHVPVEATGRLQLITLPNGPAAGVIGRHASASRREVRRFEPLRATVVGNEVRTANGFRVTKA